MVAWDGFEPSRGLLQRQVGYQLPHQAKRVGEGGFEPPTARFQTAYADLTALLAEEMVAALATGTACASTRKRNDSSSESKFGGHEILGSGTLSVLIDGGQHADAGRART